MPQALIERCTNQVPLGRQTNRTPVRWQRNQAPAGRQMLQNELHPLQLSSTTVKKPLTDQANFDKLVKLSTKRDEHVKDAAAGDAILLYFVSITKKKLRCVRYNLNKA
ncbi:unnamed protein product [Gongylonema pulchrum]|uniref:Uncharacterized protein n=1 Tax=Gongylonema pulchrum TaxID=637853 RepID=A0A183DGI7_9BILA|nr:unnamed protein product [Gongylonema pulchrum]